jgi:hypothetical protein
MNNISLLRQLRELPSIAAFVTIDVERDLLEVTSLSGDVLIDDQKVPTPAWAPFCLEDYDQMIEAISAIEEWMKLKRQAKSGGDLKFRFELKVLRTTKLRL